MLKKLLWFVILFILGIGIGLLKLNSDLNISFPTIFIAVFVLSFVFIYGNYFYVMLFTKNVDKVDSFIKKKSKHPYYALLLAMTEDNLVQAEEYMKQLGSSYSQAKLTVKATIQLQKGNYDETMETIGLIKNKNFRNYYLALHSLLQGDFKQMEEYKSQINHKALPRIIDTEAAFYKGEMAKADHLAELAISAATGLQKWSLVKSQENKKNSEDRKSYF